jgi:hypothetical protein
VGVDDDPLRIPLAGRVETSIAASAHSVASTATSTGRHFDPIVGATAVTHGTGYRSYGYLLVQQRL